MLIEIKSYGSSFSAGDLEVYYLNIEDIKMLMKNFNIYKNMDLYSIYVNNQWINGITEEDIKPILGYMRGVDREKKIDDILK